jgi:hypothetical protein
MDRLLDEGLRDRAREGLDLLGGPPGSATVHQPLACAAIMGPGPWRLRR